VKGKANTLLEPKKVAQKTTKASLRIGYTYVLDPYRLMHVIPPAGPVYAANTSGCRVASGIAGRLEKGIIKRNAWKTRQIHMSWDLMRILFAIIFTPSTHYFRA
jgi:hypothetical protein